MYENIRVPPWAPNTSSEYYMEYAAVTNEGFKKELNQKQFLFTSFRILLFFWFLSCEINMCGRTIVEGIMNGDYKMGNENV